MSLISPDLSGIADGATADAADVTNPFNTIINDYNGNITTPNFAAAGTDLATIAQAVAWVSNTPTATNLTLGNGTIGGAYQKIGSTVRYRGVLTWGSTTSASGELRISLPFNAVTTNIGAIGVGRAKDNSSGIRYVVAPGANTTYLDFAIDGSASTIDATNPMTWATGDSLSWYVEYET